jgi:hypothetical protein
LNQQYKFNDPNVICTKENYKKKYAAYGKKNNSKIV